MKALLKTLVVGCLVVLVSGCLAGCAGTVQGHAGPAFGHSGHARSGHGSGVRIPPCVPFRADEIMSWATELDNSYQQRQADVTNSNGNVNCRTNEQAGSQSNGRRHSVQGHENVQPARRNVRYQAPVEQEPRITSWGR